ncbi:MULTISPECIES: HAMP domain-containing sensor histidine kinase [unclassified Meiothermus]|uniref:sensor histidine kinase n=1 Tax=unclassified Meiothermus TaxID=370471 RepID=UPI000D7C514B|nr:MULTISPECIES: HAMP domain-containing sensor histidine kinase [unclassified Meiothermus]PZA08752.1 sensor histidine kinase [Meiothermus sp. Pnk-1]RYM40626.1 HAMP domain-containing histidine kinase [Meiothermus sp. PNK-Is4]
MALTTKPYLSLRARLFLWLLIALSLLLVPLGVLTVREAQRAAQAGLERAALSGLGVLVAENAGVRELFSLVQRFGGGVGYVVWLPGRRGAPGLLEPRISWTDRGEYRLPEGLIEALAEGQSYRHLIGDTLWLALPTEAGGIGLGVRVSEVAALPSRLFQLYTGLGVGLLVLAWSVGAWGLSRSLRPTLEMSEELSRRNPDFLEPLSEPRLAELRPAVASLNRLMDELSRAFARLKAQEKSAKRFAYGASHELRNPLAALKGYLEVLARRPGERRAIEGALREAQRMEGLLEGLLTLARLEGRGRVEGTPQDLAAFLRAYVPERLSEVIGEAQVQAEPTLLTLAVENLLKNAHRHGGGRVRARLEPDGPGFWLWIEDQGPGFAPEILPRAFEPFIKFGDGTGLGLAIVAAVARVHGGRVEAQNLAEGGARVGIWLIGAGLGAHSPAEGLSSAKR